MKNVEVTLKSHKETSGKVAGLQAIGILSNEALLKADNPVIATLKNNGLIESFAVCLKEAKVKGFDLVTKEAKTQALTGRSLIFASACLGYLTPAEIINGTKKSADKYPRLSFTKHLKTMSGLDNGNIASRIQESILQNGFVFRFLSFDKKEIDTLVKAGYIGLADCKPDVEARLILCGIVNREEVNSDTFKIRKGEVIQKDGLTASEKALKSVPASKSEKPASKPASKSGK